MRDLWVFSSNLEKLGKDLENYQKKNNRSPERLVMSPEIRRKILCQLNFEYHINSVDMSSFNLFGIPVTVRIPTKLARKLYED